ncbi:MAG: MbnP family protein [Saprospiraceae bacterium]
MKIQHLFIAFIIVGMFQACKGDQEKTGSITLHFKAFYDGQPLSMLSTKPFTAPEQLQFTRLSFFISDLALMDQSATVALKDIDLVDMSFDDINSADNGYTIEVSDLQVKNYSGLKFGIGVPADLNAKKPVNFPSSNPLSDPNAYWSGWDSFIFMKTEGRIDTLGNGAFDTGFAYHTGTNELFRTVTATLPISIEDGKNKEIDVDIDYKKILEGIDIKALPLNSNPKDTLQIGMIIRNLANALTLVQ